MTQTRRWGLLFLTLLLACLPLLAQDTATKGSVGGLIQDSSGAVVADAKVTLTGPLGNNSTTTNSEGRFLFASLTPGFYAVKVEKQGFRATEAKGIEVALGRTSSVTLKLEPGAVSEVIEVTGAATTVDTTSTTVGANLADTFYQQVPVARNVASLFYVAPGAADSGGAGHSNPSISGASGLENLYMADGVNITDSAFGGLGVFTRRQGSIGSGINLSFIKEVNVKTGGFEPQYGQATGGVVQLITKSGTNQYHGEIGAYAAPQGGEATYLQTDAVRTNLVGNFLHRANFDVDGELGGPVPGFKNRLFFFGSFNPAWAQQFVSAPSTAGLSSLGTMTLFARTYNYAGKLTFKLNDSNTIESSVFGDPTKTNTGEQNYTLNTPNDTAMSRWDYGTRNWVVRYNGTLSPTWLLNGSFTWNNSRFDEIPKYDVTQITSRTDPGNIFPLQGFGFLENHHTDSYAINFDTSKIFHWAGEHTISLGYRYERPNYTDIKTSSGPSFAAPDTNLNGEAYLTCTPGDFACPLGGPTSYVWSGGLRCAMTNPNTGQCMDATQTAAYNAAQTDPSAVIHICSQCPLGSTTNNPTGSAQDVPMYVRYGRGEFDPSKIPTYGRYHAAYINDSWQMNKFITLSLGMRWEQWRMAGTFSGYTFTDNWAPRVGVAIDPWGDRKTKIYGNFGRYNYQTPLDASIRSLSAERDILNMAFAPQADGTNHIVFNPNGTVNMLFDSAHLLNQLSTSTGGGIAIKPALGVSFTGFAPSTKLMYQDEYVVGADHEFKGGLVLSGRFIYRNLGRTLDDVSGVSPEGYAFGLLQQNYFIANPNPTLDLFPNPQETFAATAADCPAVLDSDGNQINYQAQVVDANGGTINPGTGAPWANSGICYNPNADGNFGGEVHINGFGSTPWPDGIPDGFPRPTHIYKAVEIEANKAFAHNWMMRANWRIASLTGNYEGAFRNDNGQTDPNISSLFDFTNGFVGMLGDQYKPGPLNTDRRHIVNVYVSYVVPRGLLKALELGGGVNVLSGTPISELADHPAYGNQGEVPIGGRGKDGRTPISGGVNLHADKPFRMTERMNLHFTADLFNVTNSRVVTNVDQFSQLNFNPAANPDFLKVQAWNNFGPGPGYVGYQRPFYARFSMRLTF